MNTILIAIINRVKIFPTNNKYGLTQIDRQIKNVNRNNQGKFIVHVLF